MTLFPTIGSVRFEIIFTTLLNVKWHQNPVRLGKKDAHLSKGDELLAKTTLGKLASE